MISFISLAAPNVEIKYNDRIYKLAALTFKDCAAYILWYQFKEYHDAVKTLQDSPPELRDKILEETYIKCLNKKWEVDDKILPLSWETPEVQESLNSVEGIAYQLYLALKHNHPEMTEELADEIVTLNTFDKVLKKILLVQGLQNTGEEELGEVKTPIKRKQRRR